jgi:hypothetical protein
MTTIKQLSINHNGIELQINVSHFEPARAMPMASTPDCHGYDDEGDPGEVEFQINGAVIDCEQTLIEAGGIDLEDDEIYDKVFQEMSQ